MGLDDLGNGQTLAAGKGRGNVESSWSPRGPSPRRKSGSHGAPPCQEHPHFDIFALHILPLVYHLRTAGIYGDSVVL